MFLVAVLLVACDAKPPADQAPPVEQPAASAEQIVPEPPAAPAPAKPIAPNEVILDQQVKLLDGTTKSLSDYRGKALLVVNTASECGFTPQYAELQELYGKYKAKGFEVVAFPSNDFGGQEPGTPEQIDAFVHSEYAVEFPMFDKVVTKGANKDPLYRTLTEETGEGIKGEIAWNFTKFLVDPQGRVVQRFEPPVTPLAPELIAALEKVLPTPPAQ
ncbi:glutathione peroxidase [Enhygromyxa salina]|nr:glutathione peroxidase [Enhygromyxa salina]